MAEGKVAFELVSPERLLLSQEVDMVVVPGEEGDFGVLTRHAPMISTLRPGVIQVRIGAPISADGKSAQEILETASGWIEDRMAEITTLK